MTYPVGQNTYVTASGTASTNPFITVLAPRAPGTTDLNYLVGQRWVNTANNNAEYFLIGFTASGGYVSANWILLNPGSGPITMLDGNSGGNVGPNGSGVINVVGDSSGIQFAGDAATNTLTATLANIPNSSLAHSSITVAAGANITVTGSPVSLGGTVTIASSGGGGGGTSTLTGNSGGAVSPDGGGNINTVGDGTVVTVVGDPGTNTLTTAITGVVPVAHGGTGASTLTGVLIGHGTSAVTGNAVTQYDVLVGGASNAISSVSPGGTAGVPLISQGAGSNPVFGTALVDGGGTGKTSFTAYSVITAGTTGAGAFQNVVGVGTLGQVLTSQGAGALPAWETQLIVSPVTVPNGGTGDTSFTAYAPICGGTTSTGALQSADTGISNSGYVLTSTGSGSLPTFQAPGALALTASVTVYTSGTGSYTTPAGATFLYVEMIGGGGGGAGFTGSGGSGGTTTFGTAFLSCTGGSGGSYNTSAGGAGGSASGGYLNLTGATGQPGVAGATGGSGGSSPFGGAGAGAGVGVPIGNGGAAQANTGSGGGGGLTGIPVAGGGAGGYLRALITDPYPNYDYSVGVGGTGGTGSNNSGGAGGSGLIMITAYIT